jgi:hypothetical protein
MAQVVTVYSNGKRMLPQRWKEAYTLCLDYAKEIISCPGESVSIFTIKDRIASFQRPLDF